ncbi:MAG: hypothetical protein ACOH1N_12215 [Lutibacter sp.]
MKKVNYCIALIIFLNLFTFSSCTKEDTEEIQISKSVQDHLADGEEETPVDKSKE